MGIEIERKYLVVGRGWRTAARSVQCRQGYLTPGPPCAVRVRIIDGRAYITIKSATRGIKREEFEYPIPVEDAEAMLERLCVGHAIEKRRHYVEHRGATWEIDEFEGVNAGLVVAEIELEHEDQPVELPDWVGEEVSDDPRYLNANLSREPYTEW